jgi:hypothetical protein
MAGELTVAFDPVHLKHLLDAVNVIAGFREMLLQTRSELRICRLFYHGRQRLQELLLRVINVPQNTARLLLYRLPPLRPASEASSRSCEKLRFSPGTLWPPLRPASEASS